MKKVKKFRSDNQLCEIYNSGFQLSFLSEELEQAHQWVLCKDFMTDVLWATVHQKSVGIFGFKYDPKNNPQIATSPVLIVVRNKEEKEEDFDRKIQKSHEFLLIVESRMKFPPSTLEKVEHEDDGSVWMFSVDKSWIHASPLFSMLSLFLRVGCHYTGQGKLNDAVRSFRKVDHNDARYLKRSRRMRHLILKKGLSIFAPNMEDNYPLADVDTVHNSWGIVNVAECPTFKTLWDLKGLETAVKKTKKKVKKGVK